MRPGHLLGWLPGWSAVGPINLDSRVVDARMSIACAVLPLTDRQAAAHTLFNKVRNAGATLSAAGSLI